MAHDAMIDLPHQVSDHGPGQERDRAARRRPRGSRSHVVTAAERRERPRRAPRGPPPGIRRFIACPRAAPREQPEQRRSARRSGARAASPPRAGRGTDARPRTRTPPRRRGRRRRRATARPRPHVGARVACARADEAHERPGGDPDERRPAPPERGAAGATRRPRIRRTHPSEERPASDRAVPASDASRIARGPRRSRSKHRAAAVRRPRVRATRPAWKSRSAK